jgi:hypothetical protein
MAPVPSVERAFFPLDEELGLVGTGLTPRAEETLVRLATWMPYAPARALLKDVLGVQVSKATTRRAALEAGVAALAAWEAETKRLKQELPAAPEGAEKQAMSADGAFVPLVGGEWAEVKTLVIGEVTRNKRGESCLHHLSSFSRLCDVEHFEEAALVETHRRGLEKATEVCAVQDGAEWLPGVVDLRALVAKHSDVKELTDNLAYLEKREGRCSIRPFRPQAGLSALAAWKAPTSWSSKPGSKGLACIGVGTTSTPCSSYAMQSVIDAGTRRGKSPQGSDSTSTCSSEPSAPKRDVTRLWLAFCNWCCGAGC